MRRLRIHEDDLTGEVIARFVRRHLSEMREITPPESVHALDLEALRSPDITFWSAWEGNELVGCGALKELGPETGEVKSMRTARSRRRNGVGSRVLEHITEEAERRGYRYLVLETGALPAFSAARAFYLRHGFSYRGPFDEYSADPNTVFMSRELGAAPARGG